MTLDLTKPLQLRDGRPCRLLASDLLGDYPIAVAIRFDECDAILRVDSNGSCTSGVECSTDVINVHEAPKRFRREGFINVYISEPEDGRWTSTYFSSREAADRVGTKYRTECDRRIACVKIIIEGVEGEGL